MGQTPRGRALAPLWVASLVVALGACASRAPAPASELPDAPRKPDGVAIDPATAHPKVQDRASANDGLVTLRTPLGTDRALATVEDLFRKIVVEDGDGLEPLFTREAQAVSPGAGTSTAAVSWWESRFRKLDYTRLAGEPILRAAELDIFRAGEGAEPSPAMHADSLLDGDVVIRAPIATTHAGADRLFGDEMVFFLRRDGERYKIYRMLEDFQLN